ncbi:MAG: tRNA pseudouridine(13) synthase TruD, partial [Lysobacter sp.]|nr:tRNA pseudouridine(13) synthase TruD [Lysobacter sp.]
MPAAARLSAPRPGHDSITPLDHATSPRHLFTDRHDLNSPDPTSHDPSHDASGTGTEPTSSPEHSLPRAHGAPALRARIRNAPEDFRVEELPGFAASGSGEHLLLTIEKRGMNTAFAAKRLAAW